MNLDTELELLRDMADRNKTTIDTLHEHLDDARREINRLTALAGQLEALVDAKNAEISRLNQINQGLYLA